ncbi:MAG: tetratricopeptide repeat protein [Cyclobacteriaceae bacterium]
MHQMNTGIRHTFFALGLLLITNLTAQELQLSKADSGVIIQNLEKYELLKSEKDYRGASGAINEVAFTYWNNNHFQKAIKYYETSLELNQRVANENGITMINNNLGMLYADVGLYGLSLDYFTKTLAARKANKETDGIISAQINMSLVLNKLRRYDDAIEQLTEALDLSRERQDLEQMRSVYGMLSETFEKKGDMDNSMKYFELYRSFHEEVQRQEIQKVETELLREKYAKEKIAAQNAVQENELLKQELELFRKDQIIVEKDSVNQSLYTNLSRSEMANELLKRDAEVSELEMQAKEQENATLASEKAYFRNLMIITIITALLITTLISIMIIRAKRHNKVLQEKNDAIQKKNEAIERQKEELRAANIQLVATNEHLMKTLSELEETKDRLILSGKMASLGAFTAGIAHEVNNSINYVAGSAEMLCRILDDDKELLRGTLDSEDVELIDDLKSTIKLGVNKTNNLFKKLRNSEQYGTSYIPMDVGRELRECIKVIQTKSEERNVKLITEGPKSLPIEANKEMIHQTFINLLDNAIDASPSGSEIKTTIQKAEDRIEIRISDQGSGISEEHLSKIFDPFFTTKQAGDGSGLGLYMVYGYITKHKGVIDVKSNADGTTFIITLPEIQRTESDLQVETNLASLEPLLN